MNIDFILCPENIKEKNIRKHNVSVKEARQVLLGKPRIRFAEKGYKNGDEVYAAFGRTNSGRYLSIFFVYKLDTKTAIIISARDMSAKEKKRYGKK